MGIGVEYNFCFICLLLMETVEDSLFAFLVLILYFNSGILWGLEYLFGINGQIEMFFSVSKSYVGPQDNQKSRIFSIQHSIQWYQLIKPLQNQNINLETPFHQFMQFNSEKFFFVETLFHIDSTPEITHSYLLLDQDPSLAPVVDNCENIDFFSESPKDEDTSQLRQIEEISLRSIEKIKSKKQRCHCKKTRCLKMYCECFSQGISCTKDCVCIGCHNDQKNQRNKSPKRKNAEKRVAQNVGQFTQFGQSGKGCNCKKSQCSKKYCECRNAGVKCGESCQCIQCKNCVQGLQWVQKYNSSSANDKKPQQMTENEPLGQWRVRQSVQIIKKEEVSFMVMSNELLAQIDGYITA